MDTVKRCEYWDNTKGCIQYPGKHCGEGTPDHCSGHRLEDGKIVTGTTWNYDDSYAILAELRDEVGENPRYCLISLNGGGQMFVGEREEETNAHDDLKGFVDLIKKYGWQRVKGIINV